MKISWNHLQSFFVDKLDKEHVLQRLTMAGLEVEGEESVAPSFSGIVIAEVVECEKHPDADKLSLCKVNANSGELLQIVCGAPNVKVGVKVPCAKVGAILPGDFKIAERKMRGIVSYGMLCSGDEIGCPDDVDGLLLLPADAPIGMDIREYMDLDDVIVEFKITPNRGDCLSYKGLVREIAALTGAQVKPVSDYNSYLNKLSTGLTLNVSASDACQHYVGLAINSVKNDIITPKWLMRILERSGIRSISPLVDITNYVMLTLGQPMHAFDASQLSGGIGVRMAQNGEQLTLLDETKATLADDTLVITNGLNQPVAIAGVMGGLDSGVTTATTNIVLESAYFTPDIVQGKTRKYGVNSDSAFRFERGVDSQLQHDAINLAAQLVLEICGGEVGEYIHFSAVESALPAIKLQFSEINRLVGEDIARDLVCDILTKLGCQLTVDSDNLEVIPPSYRFDLRIKQDIVEEIIRVYGYDRIEAKLPNLTYTFDYLDPKQAAFARYKDILLGYGFNEIVSYAFIEEKYAEIFAHEVAKPVRLQNPLAGLSCMRTNLLPGLVKTLQSNVNRGSQQVKVFELARVFHGEALELQPLYLSGLIYGKISPLNWLEKPRVVDFYDLRVALDELLAEFPDFMLDSSELPPIYHPGRSARIIVNDVVIGCIGQLHPKYNQQLGLDSMPYVFELNVDLLSMKTQFELCALSKYQKVSRDLAFVFNKDVQVGVFMNDINDLQLPNLDNVAVFDVFTGGNLRDSEKSVALNFVFQGDHTLSDDEVNAALEQVKTLAKNKFKAELR